MFSLIRLDIEYIVRRYSGDYWDKLLMFACLASMFATPHI